MDDGDGAYTVELQAGKVVQNALTYGGSHKCAQCDMIMNPVEYMYASAGLCPGCHANRMAYRVARKLA
jgi:uncharacterized paraquat-inducible protein A